MWFTRGRPGFAVAVLLLAAGCGEMKPRPAEDLKPPPEAPPAERATRDPNSPGASGHNSSSTLGKARDAAVRGVKAHDAHQEEVGRQADEVFKTK